MADELQEDNTEKPVSKEEYTNNLYSEYHNLLDILKTALTYSIVALAVVFIFGAIRLVTYLWLHDLTWLFSYIEYPTVATWGISLAFIFFLAFIIHTYFHITHVGWNQGTLSRRIIIVGFVYMFIARYFDENNSTVVPYTLFFMMSFLIINFFSQYIDLRHTNYNSKYKHHTIFMFLFLCFFSTFFGINDYGQQVNKHNYEATAVVKDKKWGVLFNNGNSFVLADLNDTTKIKIAVLEDIDELERIRHHSLRDFLRKTKKMLGFSDNNESNASTNIIDQNKT